MNAAFLLVTTAWFAGADAAPGKGPEKIAPPAGAPTAPANGCASCGGDTGGCDTCCEEEGRLHKMFGKLRGMFRRNRGCGCESCCEAAPAPSCAPAPAPTCCDTGDTGDNCCESRAHRLFGKLKGMFHRRGGCCESACDTCDSGDGGGCGAAPAAAPKAEQIPAPGNKEGDHKKMPTGVEPPFKPVGLDAAPAVAPRVTVEAEKSPF